MLTVSTLARRIATMADKQGPKPKGAYHHGDLGRALVEAAAGIIAAEGTEALTLRGVGERVGVSRTALYRHFDDKAALLAAVALEGFRRLRHDLEAAVRSAEAAGTEPLVALGVAYVEFGIKHPPHYRTMFGPSLKDRERNPDLMEEGRAAFGVLAQVIAAGQAAGRLVPGDPVRLAQVVWSTIHGIVALGGDGHFAGGSPAPESAPALAAFAPTVLLAGLLVRPD